MEIDGDIHKERKDYDKYRDDFMLSLGIKTLRFNNNEIIQNIEHVIDTINDELLKHR
ncbi:MAG: DUF559 domain-containing protein [Spirochaetes bacterium]|nr:DUF559 domain-containing protein [Spirochaetota bacterium]